jgi:hypothetical protein
MMRDDLRDRLLKTLDAVSESYLTHGLSKEEFLNDCKVAYETNVWIRSGI